MKKELITRRMFKHTEFPDKDKCWNWKCFLNLDGYGNVRFKDKTIKVHRMAYFLFKGDIPDHLEVCHSCDNPACVNPNHLWLGTHADNVSDCAKKGRIVAPSGEKHYRAKLTWQKVNEIRNLAKTISRYKLAKQFGVHYSTLDSVVNGETWKT